MIKLTGTYADEEEEMKFICRVSYYNGTWYDPIARVVLVKDGDVLKQHKDWFALYSNREVEIIDKNETQ